MTTDARRSYRQCELDGIPESEMPRDAFPGSWIVDETRRPEVVSVWDDSTAYIETVKHAYRRDYWQDQPNYCEVWSEKGTVLATLRPVTNELGVTLRVCRGFGSTGMETVIGEFFETLRKNIFILFLGDHDPSGHCLERDIHRRTMAASGRDDIHMIRLAIHPEDIAAYHLPPQRIKSTDSRAKEFQRRFGEGAATVELDALPVDDLRVRVRRAIEQQIDWTRWNRQTKVEAAEIASIAEIADKIKNLPQLPG